MMLTWKIFVIIMSVVSLTLVNVNSSSGSSSSGPYRQLERGGSSLNVDSSYASSYSTNPVFNPKAIFKLYDNEKQLCIKLEYNTYNPFDESEKIGYDCFKHIKLFCDTENSFITSENCAHGGMVIYKKSFVDYNDGKTYLFLSDAAHYFFGEFPMTIGDVNLPTEFCNREADNFINELNNYEVYFKPQKKPNDHQEQLKEIRESKYKLCMEELECYQDLVIEPEIVFNDQETVYNAILKSREEIVKFARINKSIMGMVQDSSEANYLKHISYNISSSNEHHNPHVYCRKIQDNYENGTQTLPPFP